MNALKLETQISETIASAIPGLRPLLGRRVELIVLDPGTPTVPNKLSWGEFLARRPKLPPGAPVLSLDDMDRAIAAGASGASGV